MPEQTIICPNCGKRIPVSEALTHQIESGTSQEFASKAIEREKTIKANAEKQALINAEKKLLAEKPIIEDRRKKCGRKSL